MSSGRGNAFDIASLLIALLRASGIPARYVQGTVEVPAAQFMNWAGGFTDINAAVNFAASGGIPTGIIEAGGRIAGVQLEHLWVEAALDYFPSRGAVNRSADTWIPLDASFKQHEQLPGLDALAIANLDGTQLAQGFLASGTLNEAEGWVSGLNPALLENAQQQMDTALQAYLQANLPNPTVGDVLGGQRIVAQERSQLAASLPYTTVVRGVHYAQLPPSLRHQVRFHFGQDPLQEPQAFAWPALNNQKVTLAFRPATPADEQTLRALLPAGGITDPSQLPSTIPAYLIEVLPELRVNGAVVMTGSALHLGETLNLRFEVTDPRLRLQRFNSPVLAGSYLAIPVVAGSVSVARLEALRSQLAATRATLETADPTQLATLTGGQLLGDLFYTGALGYFAQYLGLGQVMARPAQYRWNLTPSIGTFGYVPTVSYLLGFPLSISPGPLEVDLDRVGVVTAALNNDKPTRLNAVRQLGVLSSALEHIVPEQLFVNAQNPGEAVSAVKALTKANAAGQRVYTLTAANQAEALPHIHHDAGTMAEIRTALAAGLTVITHTDAVSVPGWSGAGYILLDPLTGDGAYKISGGKNGGWYTLLTFASVTLLLLVIGPVGFLVSFPFVLALLALFVLTSSLMLIFGVDMTTYGDEINFITGIGSTASAAATLIKVALYLGEAKIAKQFAVIVITIELILGAIFLGNEKV